MVEKKEETTKSEVKSDKEPEKKQSLSRADKEILKLEVEVERLKGKLSAAKEELKDRVSLSREDADELRELLSRSLKTSNNIAFRKQLKKLIPRLG